MKIECIINGEQVKRDIKPNTVLIDFLRNNMGLTGTKESCGEGECGACTVLLNGKSVNACLVLAAKINGCELLTIEGLAKDKLDPLQQSFIDNVAIQCGYCTPGMIMAAKGLLLENPQPTEEEIRSALAGNICRCSDYSTIVKAVIDAASLAGLNKYGDNNE